jgi:hypothetical protein
MSKSDIAGQGLPETVGGYEQPGAGVAHVDHVSRDPIRVSTLQSATVSVLGEPSLDAQIGSAIAVGGC